MTNEIKVPGVIYSMLLAGAAYLIDYFTSGDGSASLIAPVIVAAVPIILKMFTATGEDVPDATSRGVEPVQRRSYAKRVLLG